MKNLIILGFLLIPIVCSSQNYITTNQCQDSSNERVRRHCINKELEEYANKFYNVKRIAQYANPGENRIYTRFNIDNLGRIESIQVKGTAQELEQEAIRVLEQFDQLIIKNYTDENAVATQDNNFTLVISFNLTPAEVTEASTAGY